jgi:hypothetical protein
MRRGSRAWVCHVTFILITAGQSLAEDATLGSHLQMVDLQVGLFKATLLQVHDFYSMGIMDTTVECCQTAADLRCHRITCHSRPTLQQVHGRSSLGGMFGSDVECSQLPQVVVATGLRADSSGLQPR